MGFGRPGAYPRVLRPKDRGQGRAQLHTQTQLLGQFKDATTCVFGVGEKTEVDGRDL